MKVITMFIGVLVLVAGVALGVVAGRDLIDSISRSDGPTVAAVVTDKQLSTSMVRGVRRTSHDVRYEFESDGATYTAGDSTGRTDLFIGIDEDRWNQLEEGDSIEVTHEDGNPANNRPLESGGGVGDSIAGLVFGLLLAFIGAMMILSGRRPATPDATPESAPEAVAALSE
jgi:hypothetical protein